MKKTTLTTLALGGFLMLALYAPHAFAEGNGIDLRGDIKINNGSIKQDMRAKISDDTSKENRPLRLNLESSLKANDYAAFSAAISGTPFAGKISQEQFNLIVKAYSQYQSGDMAAAEATLKSSTIDPMIASMVHAYAKVNLSDAQKTAIKQAKALFDAGNIEQAKITLTAAGLPALLPQPRSEDMKQGIQRAKELQKSGDSAGAHQALKDAGIPDRAINKISKELPKKSSEKHLALEQAAELRKSGDIEAANKVLIDAKISKPQKFFWSLKHLFSR